jgi:para-nitrobenzyl esterase
MKIPACIFVASLAALATPVFAQPAAAVIATEQGRVSGVPDLASDAYLAIPFARPPVGPLRWRPPEAPAVWNGVRDGSHFSANCYQAPATGFGPFTPEFMADGPVSEDCLYLNVWKPTGPAKNLPVLVFIHGGGLGGGAGSIPIYNGARLAAKGAVVITINYRLGAFGFLAHPELTAESPRKTSGNYGLLDTIAALKWVRANVSCFGGDPANVTVSGQSAGAMLVNDLLMSPEAKGLFSAAIAESGTGAGIAAPPLAAAEAVGVEFAGKVGAHSLADLRAAPASTILEFSGAGPPKPGEPRRLGFVPTADGKVITANPNNPRAEISVDVPFLTGWNRDEGAGLSGMTKSTSPAQFESAVRGVYGSFAERVLAAYPHANDAEATQSANLLPRELTLASLALWAEARTTTSGQRVYVYQFAHTYPGPDSAEYGAFHTAEVPYIFGVLDQQGRPFNDADRAVSEQMQAYWLGFMTTHKPTAPGRPAGPPIEAGRLRILQLGDTSEVRPAVSTPERLAILKAFIASQKQSSVAIVVEPRIISG